MGVTSFTMVHHDGKDVLRKYLVWKATSLNEFPGMTDVSKMPPKKYTAVLALGVVMSYVKPRHASVTEVSTGTSARGP